MTTKPQMPSLLAPQAAPTALPTDVEIADAILRQMAIRIEAQRLAEQLVAEGRLGRGAR